MLDAKAKDQGHKRKCSQKKGLQKIFSGDFQKYKKGFQKKILGDFQKKPFSKKIFRRSTNF